MDKIIRRRKIAANVLKVSVGKMFPQSQEKKFKKTLYNAKKNSPFYRDLYKDINIDKITIDNIGLLPPLNKHTLLEEFDEWTCDRSITKTAITEFADKPGSLEKLFDNKYFLDSTSGTTGEKFYVPSNQSDFYRILALNMIQSWPKKSYVVDILKSRKSAVYIIPTDGFYMSHLLAKAYVGFSNGDSSIIDFRTKLSTIVEKLNDIQPIFIICYASTLLSLADEQKNGNLHISPKYIMPLGSRYDDEARQYVKESFGCETFTSYGCTECGAIGYECTEGHFHIAEDIIVEAVDEHFNPVEDGSESSKLLVTNLWNTTAPLIRYEINDHCTIHSEGCKCGNKNKWIDVKGRDTLRIPFTTRNNGQIYLADFTFELILHEMPGGFAGYQIKVYEGNVIEVYINASNDNERMDKFKIIREKLKVVADDNNIEATINMSNQNPVVENSGKIRPIMYCA